MVQLRSLKEIAFSRKTGHYMVVSVVMATLVCLSSCKKGTEFDGYANHMYNPLSAIHPTIYDTIGIDQFLAEKYLGISFQEQRLLYHAKQNGLFTIEGIALPESDNPQLPVLDTSIRKMIFDCGNSNYFFGYPSAFKNNYGTLVVAEKRASQTSVNEFSDGMIFTQNTSGGWDENDFFKYAPYGLSWNGTRPLLGTLPDGRIIVKGKGLLISSGDLHSWKSYPYAFQDLLKSNKQYHDYGGTMTYSSKFGLFFGTGQANIDSTVYSLGALFSVNVDNGKVSLAKNRWFPKVMRVSTQQDTTYSYISSISYPTFTSVEHSDLAGHKGDIVGLGISDLGSVYQYVYHYKDGDTFDSIQFKLSKTNLVTASINQSPLSIYYNQYTKRFELIESQPDQINIWSISTDDLFNSAVDLTGIANWTFETNLFSRLDVDVHGQGMFPVSSIIDETTNTQTVFFYAGEIYPARSGLFKLTKTMDTQKLGRYVNAERAHLAHIYTFDQ